ncbi:hypothetical protein D910_08270, partial [Dendroctonus ponderosae]
TSQEQWVSAEGYFGVTPQEESSGTSRASIAKLRSQNLGMVRAKARLFDHLQDVDTSGQAGQSSEKTPLKTPSADGSRKSYRIKCMRAEERRRKKGSTSPRRRQAVLSQKQKLQSIGRQYAARCNSSTQRISTRVQGTDFDFIVLVCKLSVFTYKTLVCACSILLKYTFLGTVIQCNWANARANVAEYLSKGNRIVGCHG